MPAVLVARHIAFHAAVPTQAITPWQNLAEAARTAWAGAFTALFLPDHHRVRGARLPWHAAGRDCRRRG